MRTYYRKEDHNEPTYKNQLYRARKLLDDKGPEALYNPHVLTGKLCGCRDCFCCAALEVYRKFVGTRTPDELKGKATA